MNRIVNDPFSFYRWERAWLPRHTPGTSDPDKGERRRKQSKRVYWTKRSYNGSGQERRYGGKFACAPWLSKLLNNISFSAGSADSAVEPVLL